MGEAVAQVDQAVVESPSPKVIVTMVENRLRKRLGLLLCKTWL
jgi:hypothetical protein